MGRQRLLAAWWLGAAVACGGKAQVGIATTSDRPADAGETSPAPAPDADVANREARAASCDGWLFFADRRVEESVRQAIPLRKGPITSAHVPRVTHLELYCAFEVGVSKRPESIISLEGLQCLTGITDIDSIGCVVTDFSPLAPLAGLRTARFMDSFGFGTLPSFPSLPELKSLELGWNALTDIAPLSSLSHLEGLGLTSNSIRDISSLRAIPGLKRLELGYNPIVDISPLATLPLTDLGLFETSVTNLSPLASMRSLTHVDLANNAIVDVAALGTLSNLEYLDLSDNKITDVSALTSLKKLGFLSLRSNPLNCDAQAANLATLKAQVPGLVAPCPGFP